MQSLCCHVETPESIHVDFIYMYHFCTILIKCNKSAVLDMWFDPSTCTYDDIIRTPEYHVKIHHSVELFIYFSGPEFPRIYWSFFDYYCSSENKSEGNYDN